MLDQKERLTHLSPDAFMKLDVAAHRANVNALLLETSGLVRAEACGGKSTYSGCQKTLGRGADLTKSILLAQGTGPPCNSNGWNRIETDKIKNGGDVVSWFFATDSTGGF